MHMFRFQLKNELASDNFMNDFLLGFLSSRQLEVWGIDSSLEEATLVFNELLEGDFTKELEYELFLVCKGEEEEPLERSEKDSLLRFDGVRSLW